MCFATKRSRLAANDSSDSPSFTTLASGVGQDEEPIPLVGSTGVVRSHTTPFRIEPQSGKVSEHDVESSRSESCDVFNEHEPGSYLANDPSELAPESAPLASDALPLSCVADVLAGESASDAIHAAAPRAAIEGDNIVPDRRLLQGRVFHPRHESGRGVGFPLDVHHSATSGHGECDTEVESSSSSEEGTHPEGR